MSRWTQTWMQDLGTSPARAPGDNRGSGLGLPADGPGAVATWGVRFAAFFVDAIGSGLIARLIDPPEDLQTASASLALAPIVVLVVITVLGLALVGQTPGMKLFKIRVVPLTGNRDRLGFVPAVLRTVLLTLLVPVLITDRDGRGLHDKLARSVVVRIA